VLAARLSKAGHNVAVIAIERTAGAIELTGPDAANTSRAGGDPANREAVVDAAVEVLFVHERDRPPGVPDVFRLRY
jgi:hypothetical protein